MDYFSNLLVFSNVDFPGPKMFSEFSRISWGDKNPAFHLSSLVGNSPADKFVYGMISLVTNSSVIPCKSRGDQYENIPVTNA